MRKAWDTAPLIPPGPPCLQYLNFQVGIHLVLLRLTRFLKGVFELKPSLPRYTTIWDVGTVLQYLKTLHPIPEVNLKTLTKKLTMLFAF